MAFHIDPRGDLPPPTTGHTTYAPRPFSYQREHDMRRRSVQLLQKPNRKLCHDWIFSSSTNVHVAIDKPAFKTYTTFDSYALSLADQRKIEVKGIGSVELKIRCKPGSRSEHTIVLENVLHIPSSLCNIFSDIYFYPPQKFEHVWTELGVNFMARDKDKLHPWGYTESFRGLDRLVLGRRHDGRSPMADDKDREVYSVNITWPKSQQDEWKAFASTRLDNEGSTCKSPVAHAEIRRFGRGAGNLSEQSSRSHLEVVSTSTTPTKKPRVGRIGTLRVAASTLSLVRAATLR